tara:strand:+ start:1021 stop:1419 length:399 start_codon:yes stop_codon:yes gene_type:complete
MAIYCGGDIIGVNDASGRTSWAAGNAIPKGVWTEVLDSGLQSSAYSTSINCGELYSAIVLVFHNDDNAIYDAAVWLASGDHAGATIVQVGRVYDTDRLDDLTISCSSGVKTITFGMDATSGSRLNAYIMRNQ